MDILAQLGGIANIGAGALVAYFVIQIFRGKWVGWRMYEQLVVDRDKWREVAEKESAANAELLDQNSLLIRGGETTQHLLKSLPPGGAP